MEELTAEPVSKEDLCRQIVDHVRIGGVLIHDGMFDDHAALLATLGIEDEQERRMIFSEAISWYFEEEFRDRIPAEKEGVHISLVQPAAYEVQKISERDSIFLCETHLMQDPLYQEAKRIALSGDPRYLEEYLNGIACIIQRCLAP